VPEAGDEIQTMKAGLMEIADIFVVNKSDRPDADLFVRNLKTMLAPAFYTKQVEVPVIKTIASQKTGIESLLAAITKSVEKFVGNGQRATGNEKHSWLLAEKAYHLIQQKRMMDVSKAVLKNKIEAEGNIFNLYQFVQNYQQWK
jgi:LAO/AO transport system kinase